MLYVCATPIGNLGDVTPRVLDALREAELVAAEDTRRTRKLLSHFDIHTPLTSFFQHNELQKTDEVLGCCARARRSPWSPTPGCPACRIPACCWSRGSSGSSSRSRCCPARRPSSRPSSPPACSGDGFRFIGYLPRRARELEARSARVAPVRRPRGRLRQRGSVWGAVSRYSRRRCRSARAAVCRELTKVHEEVVRGTLLELSERYPVPGPDAGPAAAVRGEITLVIDLGRPLDPEASRRPEAATAAAALLSRGLSRRDAASALHLCLGVPRREADKLVREVAAAALRPAGRSRAHGQAGAVRRLLDCDAWTCTR